MKKKFATTQDIKSEAIKYMLEFIMEDQDARIELRRRLGMMDSQPCIDAVNDSLEILWKEAKKSGFRFGGKV